MKPSYIQFILVVIIVNTNTSGQTPSNGDQHWILNTTISDEFNYNGNHAQVINQLSNKWHFIESWGNKKVYDANWNEVFPKSYVTDDGSNIEIVNGVCELYAKYEPGTYNWPCTNCWANQGYNPKTFNYTKGHLIRNSQTSFGYYEISIRLPYYHNQREKTVGVGPNFWFFRENNNTPPAPYAYAEIDVFEQLDNRVQKYGIPNYSNKYCFGTGVHFDQNNNSNGRVQNAVYGKIGWENANEYWKPLNYFVDFSDGQFHKIGFEWQKDYISVYLDGVEVSSLNFEQGKIYPMNAYLDINLTEVLEILNLTQFPFKYEIDYFRYYQFANNLNPTNLNITSSNYSNLTLGYDKKLNIYIGGPGITAKVAAGTNLVLRADESIILDEGFEIDEQTQLYLQVTTR
jgi:hypothetical protein